MFTLSDIARLRLGGTRDTAALSAIGAGALISNPFLGLPLAAGVGAGGVLAAAGGAALANRLADILSIDTFENRDPEATRLNSSKPPQVDGDGIHLGYLTDTGEPLVIPLRAWARHAGVYGMTGSGKTVLAFWLMYAQILRGGGLMFVDAKVDADNVTFVRAMCAAAGREHDLLILNPGDPANSNTYNPVLFGDPDEISARCLALVPQSSNNPGTDYYRSAASESMTKLIAGFKATGLPYNPLDIAVSLQSDKVMAEIRGLMDSRLTATKQFDQWYQRFAAYGRDGSYAGVDMKKLNDTLGGITGKIYQFGSGNFGPICNSYTPEIVLEDVILQSKILYVSLPSLSRTESAQQFGRLLMGDLRTATGRIQQMPVDRRPNPPFLAILDEFSSYATEQVGALAEQARSAGVCLVPFVQQKASYELVSKEFRAQMNANSLTRIFFKTNEPDTAKWIEEMGGTEMQVRYSVSSSGSESNSNASISNSKIRGGTESASVGISESLVEGPRIPASAVGSLADGECIVQFDGNRIYQIKVPLLKFDKAFLKELGPIQINRARQKTPRGLNAFQIADRIIAERRKKESEKR